MNNCLNFSDSTQILVLKNEGPPHDTLRRYLGFIFKFEFKISLEDGNLENGAINDLNENETVQDYLSSIYTRPVVAGGQ